MDSMSWCDWEKEELNTGRWRIMKRCNQGYDPYYTLHKRRSLMGIKWWSGTIKFSETKQLLIDFANKYDLFPSYCYEDK